MPDAPLLQMPWKNMIIAAVALCKTLSISVGDRGSSMWAGIILKSDKETVEARTYYGFERARIYPCRKGCKIDVGFSPGGKVPW